MKLLMFALVGVAAQLVDGALGMAFGVTATTLLIFNGLAPAYASAAVHFAEVGTSLFSGLSHWKLRNVHWPTALALGVPGAVGAFLGAYVLSSLSLKAAEPVVTTLLIFLGAYVLVRFATLPWKREQQVEAARSVRNSRLGLGALGLAGGFMDATGGGGWGPVTTSTLMSVSKEEPRRIIGTVNTAEFLVAVAASVGFIAGLGSELQENWQPVVGLLIGGALAAPIAALVVSKVNPTVLGIGVGLLLIGLNSARLVKYVGPEVLVGLIVLALVVIVAIVRVRKRSLLEASLRSDAVLPGGAAAGAAAGSGHVAEPATNHDASDPASNHDVDAHSGVTAASAAVGSGRAAEH